MIDNNSNLTNALRVLFSTLFENQFKGLPIYERDWYLHNRMQNRIFLILRILKINEHHELFNFIATKTIEGTYKLHSEELHNFLIAHLSEEKQPSSLTKEAKKAVTEVNKLTCPYIKDKEHPGVDPVLNGACLLIYKMSQYGFPESHYIMDATKEIFYSNQDYPLMWEILQKTQDILKHPVFMDLQYKFDHFTAEVKHDVSVKMKEETIFLNNINNL